MVMDILMGSGVPKRREGGVAAITVFLEPALFAVFGMPSSR